MSELLAPTSATSARHDPFEDQVATLQKGGAVERVEAAKQLKCCGSRALPPLCEALIDPCVPVRLAGAEALGEIGDPAAIPALVRAFKDCFAGGSPRRQLAIGSAVTVGLGAGCLLLAVLSPISTLEILLRTGFEGLCNLGRDVPKREPEPSRAPVYIRALTRIAERNSTPELRALLPELRAASLDVLQVDTEARRISGEAARRIETLTTRLMSLPVPAAVPDYSVDSLPRLVEGAPSGEALPRVT